MMQAEIDQIVNIAREFWPKSSPSELGLLAKKLKDYDFAQVKEVLGDARFEGKYSSIPFDLIRAKVRHVMQASEGTQAYTQAYVVVTRGNQRYKTGRLIEVCFTHKTGPWDTSKIIGCLNLSLREAIQRFGEMDCEFYVGDENDGAARARAFEIRQAEALKALEAKEKAEISPDLPGTLPTAGSEKKNDPAPSQAPSRPNPFQAKDWRDLPPPPRDEIDDIFEKHGL